VPIPTTAPGPIPGRMIDVRDLSFGHAQPDDLFAGFDWSVERGEIWSILGPSGCGKTTLLYLLAGLRAPTRGSILVDGRPVEGVRLKTSLILQDHGLLPWATVEANAALGLQIRGVAARQRVELVGHWLEVLGIADLRRRYPSQLSGGQRQRVAIARALVLDPDLLLMDEPFASLDALTREELQEAMLALRLAAERPLTIVLVTHDVAEAVLLGQRVMVLSRPPIRDVPVFANPLAGRQEYRLQPEYHAKCLEVRAAIVAVRGSPVPNEQSGRPASGLVAAPDGHAREAP
jgi:ABC-type nitrate/sulfonate/bicarbonate transport system ATPase subunit